MFRYLTMEPPVTLFLYSRSKAVEYVYLLSQITLFELIGISSRNPIRLPLNLL